MPHLLVNLFCWICFPVGRYFKIRFGNLFLFILPTCKFHLFLYSCILSRTGVTSSSDSISSFLLWSCQEYLAVLLRNFISAATKQDLSFLLMAQLSHPYNSVGTARVFILLILCAFELEKVLKLCLLFQLFQGILSFC